MEAPAGVDGQKVVSKLREQGIWIAGGQAQAKGKIFRIAHMGFIDTVDLLGTLGGLETVLNELGYKVEPGAGLRAAQASLDQGGRGMKVLISDNLHQAGIDILKSHPNIDVVARPGMKPEELLAEIKDADALVIRSATKVTADLIAAAPRLKVVGRAGTGLDNVDIPAASKRGIVVMNTPGGNTITTAEHALSLMMALARNIPQAANSMREGKWEKKKFQGTELFNKTLGIIGMGRIGTVVAERGLGLRMRVLCYDPFITKELAAKIGAELVSLDELLARSDFITIHTPKTKDTAKLLSKEAFMKMKPGVRLINCARGGLIDEAALLERLEGRQSGRRRPGRLRDRAAGGRLAAAGDAQCHLHPASGRLHRRGPGQCGGGRLRADPGTAALRHHQERGERPLRFPGSHGPAEALSHPGRGPGSFSGPDQRRTRHRGGHCLCRRSGQAGHQALDPFHPERLALPGGGR